MKEGFDKEIDSLLRGRVVAGARLFGDDVPRDAAHLDADELSAFAEGALPPPSRVAAVTHLADCDECRGRAVSLARAAGIEAELEKRAVTTVAPIPASKPERGWLSAVFAPRLLRYVAPVLAVSLIAAVSFIALRTRKSETNVARQTTRSESAPAGITSERQSVDDNVASNANANVGASGEGGSLSRNTGASNMSAPAGGHGGAVEAESPAPADVDARKKDEAPAPPPPSKAGETPAETATVADKPATEEPKEVAKSEGRAKAAPPVNEDAPVAVDEAQLSSRRGNQARGVEPQMPDGSRNQQKRGTLDNTQNNTVGGPASNASRADRDRAGAAAGAGAPASRRARQAEDERERGEDSEKDRFENKRSEDTRSAVGHRFRREGGAWVDVNFKSSMPQTGVRRGTEAFRALVADIPEVGRVAEQVNGEVVVVIRGHAYRIR